MFSSFGLDTSNWFHEVNYITVELDRVVGSSRLPTWEDEINLPYLRATIKEMHRWAPIASLGFPHATSEEDWYLGHYVPQGTIVIPNIPALSRDPQVYEDPESFCPERFLGNDLNAAASAKNPDFRKRDHFHYGFGRRFCQGIFVAEASLYIAVARVIWTFAISIQPGAPPLDMGDKFGKLCAFLGSNRHANCSSPGFSWHVDEAQAMSRSDCTPLERQEERASDYNCESTNRCSGF